MVQNYIRLKTRSPFSRQYMFIDTSEYLADNLFCNHKVPLKFGKEMVDKDTKYVIISCKIHKQYEEQFVKALLELPNKMLLFGHTDYIEYCKKVFDMLNDYQQEKTDRKS